MKKLLFAVIILVAISLFFFFKFRGRLPLKNSVGENQCLKDIQQKPVQSGSTIVPVQTKFFDDKKYSAGVSAFNFSPNKDAVIIWKQKCKTGMLGGYSDIYVFDRLNSNLYYLGLYTSELVPIWTPPVKITSVEKGVITLQSDTNPTTMLLTEYTLDTNSNMLTQVKEKYVPQTPSSELTTNLQHQNNTIDPVLLTLKFEHDGGDLSKNRITAYDADKKVYEKNLGGYTNMSHSLSNHEFIYTLWGTHKNGTYYVDTNTGKSKRLKILIANNYVIIDSVMYVNTGKVVYSIPFDQFKNL